MTVTEMEPTDTPSKPKIKGLDPTKIKFLVGTGRARNAYGPKLMIFVDSDEAAINPREVWPIEFGEKIESTLYQGFQSAVTKAGLKDVVQVKQADGEVFLMHKERINLMLAEEAGLVDEDEASADEDESDDSE